MRDNNFINEWKRLFICSKNFRIELAFLIFNKALNFANGGALFLLYSFCKLFVKMLIFDELLDYVSHELSDQTLCH